MCLIIYQPKGATIPRASVAEAFATNPHGAGFAVALRGKVYITKGWFQPEPFAKELARYAGQACLVHFRQATHGKVCAALCHPFEVQQYAIAHNGILDCPNNLDRQGDISDTTHFLSTVLSPLLAHFTPEHAVYRVLLERYCMETFNKLAILTPDGKCHIFGQSLGEWHRGLWYSHRQTPSPWPPWQSTPKNTPKREPFPAWQGRGPARNWAKAQDERLDQQWQDYWQRS